MFRKFRLVVAAAVPAHWAAAAALIKRADSASPPNRSLIAPTKQKVPTIEVFFQFGNL